MKLGILSDTHDSERWLKHAITALSQRGASFIVHCGDICSPEMLDLLVVRPDEACAGFVFGNGDDDRADFEERAKALGIICFGEFGEFEVAGKKFAVIHGDDPRALRLSLETQKYDYLLCGHTHEWRDERVGRTRIINPGPAALLRNRQPPVRPTVALLSVENDWLEKICLA